MSAAVVVPCNGPDRSVAPAHGGTEPVAFRFSQAESFAPLLKTLGVSLLVTTYQANKLLAVRESAGRLSILVRTFERPMGLAVGAGRFAMGTLDQVWEFRDAADLAARVEPAGAHDACFIPRCGDVTGDVGVHELAWGAAGELWLVATRFSCLVTLHPDYSFVPRWRPPFVSALAAEDRCHLNGVAVVGGRPAFVTALGTADTRAGWRAGKAAGGCLLSVPDGRVIAGGLCMPHTPRHHDGRLWVLESGTGRLLLVPDTGGGPRAVAELNGFARGMGLCEHYAFVGLSKIRAASAMDGVPLAARRGELQSGVAAVDLRSGRVVAQLTFESAVEEVFDVKVLPGLRFPEVLGFQKDAVRHTFVVPREAPAWPAIPGTSATREGNRHDGTVFR
jgi:uncharacterized protein (TIGR03032 family)